MEEKRLAKLYNALKAQNYDVPNSYDEFEEKLTRKGDDGASRRHKLYNALKSQGFDVVEYRKVSRETMADIVKEFAEKIGDNDALDAVAACPPIVNNFKYISISSFINLLF